MAGIPSRWRLEPHYEPSLVWYTRDPKEGLFPQEWEGERRQALEDEPGWYVFCSLILPVVVDSPEEALAVLKSSLKRGDLACFGGGSPPVRLSKRERKRLVLDLLGASITPPPPDYDPDSEGPVPVVLERRWELNGYLLVARVFYTPFRPEFETKFGAPDNPVRSLEGRVCLVYAAYPEDEEDEDYAWEELARGPVRLEGNRLTVGFWTREFDPETPVEGVAYEGASFAAEGVLYHLEPLTPSPDRGRGGEAPPR